MQIKVAILSLLSIASVAQAEVKRLGTVVPTQCADVTMENPRVGGFVVTQICDVNIVGKDGKYLASTESRASGPSLETITVIWSVKDARRLGQARELQLVESGGMGEDGQYFDKVARSFVTGTVQVKFNRTGGFESMTGNLDEREFSAKNFYTVLTTM